MKSWERDPESHLLVIDRVLELVKPPPGRVAVLRAELRRYMGGRVERGRWLEPEVTRLHSEWYRELYAVIGTRDPFAEVKDRSNRAAEALLAEVGPRSLEEWLGLSILANRLDFGFFEFGDGKMLLPGGFFALTPGKLAELPELPRLAAMLRGARRVLFLPDNHGEIIFDREVARAILAENPRCQITFAGKGWPLLNDVTAKELIELGITKIAEVISTGTNSFGAPRSEVSAEFLAAFRSSDVVLAKGQAHLEFWLSYSVTRLFNLVHLKIPVRDAVFGELEPGRNLLLASEFYGAGKPAYET
jgi:uncharacterized protein with ATP-grasp and redox domains